MGNNLRYIVLMAVVAAGLVGARGAYQWVTGGDDPSFAEYFSLGEPVIAKPLIIKESGRLVDPTLSHSYAEKKPESTMEQVLFGPKAPQAVGGAADGPQQPRLGREGSHRAWNAQAGWGRAPNGYSNAYPAWAPPYRMSPQPVARWAAPRNPYFSPADFPQRGKRGYPRARKRKRGCGFG